MLSMNTQAQGRVSILNREAFVQSRSNGSTPTRVLMADPDVSLPSVYREPLLRGGFELGTAVSGLECVARLRECVPDVLVLEPQMPWGGGNGVLAIMGESAELAMIPVMILTSCRDRDALNSVERFPINDYHVKPLAPDRLAGRLRSILDQPRFRFALGDQNGLLECAIARRTGGRVWDLRVEACDGRVIVRGRSDSHHVKQLALAAVQEAFESAESQPETVELEIEVAPADKWRSRRPASTRREGEE
jgi:DNA-binding response OmpR family regulator